MMTRLGGRPRRRSAIRASLYSMYERLGNFVYELRIRDTSSAATSLCAAFASFRSGRGIHLQWFTLSHGLHSRASGNAL
jgi:hypothetical protein